MVVPLGILGGVLAALYRDRWPDRILSVVGLSATVVPEFVSGIILILIFGVWLAGSRSRPRRRAMPGSSCSSAPGLPSIPLVLVLFGYIARMARAGMIEALDADYTRTAVLKGLSFPRVIWRHVLRNALLPTISVISTQTAIDRRAGGDRDPVSLSGIGSLIYVAATKKDFPMLQDGIMAIGILFTITTLFADLLYAVLNARIRFQRQE